MQLKHSVFAAGVIALSAGAALGDLAHRGSGEVTIDLPFPTFGFFETFFGSGNTDLDGFTVTDATLFLELEVTSGDAANITFFQLLPVDIDPSTPAIDDFGVGFLSGSELGWSGTGTFSTTFDLSPAIGGAFLADTIYVGGLFGQFGQIGGPPGDQGFVTDNSVFQLTLVPSPSSVALLGLAAPLAFRRRR